MPLSKSPESSFLFFYLGFGFWVFVCYGSLVPLDYQPFPLDQAIVKFQNINYLDLGIESRADWIANILLYIPLSFLFLGSFRAHLKRRFSYRIIFSILCLGFCLATAVGIEFVQQFFPPRTVSINDLVAETLGTIIGMVLWFSIGEKTISYCRQIGQGNWLSIQSAIIIFLPIYIFLSLFPFDFVTSVSELQSKLATGQDRVFIDIEGLQESPLRCFVKWTSEILVLAPIGGLFAALPAVSSRISFVVLIGFLLGVVIETTQVFIYSGSGQGISVITRMLGMGLGFKAYGYFSNRDLENFRPLLGKFIGLMLFPYNLMVFAVNGWLEGHWMSISAAQQKLSETNFLPFYYFYYTTETVALVSLLSNIGIYMPVGFLFWLNKLKKPYLHPLHSFWVGGAAAFFALIVETGKLFLPTKHIDPTDILLAFFAGAITYQVLNAIQAILTQSKRGFEYTLLNSESVETSKAKLLNTDIKGLLIAVFIGTFSMFAVVQYPLMPLLMMAGMGLYGIALFQKPLMGLFVLPALLPVMDFTPWTGRFFFDEFDLLVLTTFIVYLLLPAGKLNRVTNYRLVNILFIGLFGVLILISLTIGLLPLSEMDANAFSNYYSHYNALRIGKGFLWALLLGPYFIHGLLGDQGRRYFSLGLLSGLIGLAIFSVLERWVFPGLFDFSTDYRINALFSTMHTGGGHIESYLALSMPFTALFFVNKKYKVFAQLGGLMVFFLSLYTLLMTFSRGGMVGVAVAFLVLLAGFLYHFTSHRQLKIWRFSAGLGFLLLVIGLIAVPVFKGDLINQRISLAEEDKESRQSHWAAAINMMNTDFVTQIFGMGLGSFPRTFFWSNQENSHPATYRVGIDQGNQYLALQGGDALFMGQYIAVKPHQTLKLSVDVRGSDQNLVLSIPICEKSLQYSFRCVGTEIKTISREWQRITKDIDMGDVGATSSEIANGKLTRPVQLALYAGSVVGKIIEVDNLSLVGDNGKNIIINGDFSAGMDRWYFSTEKHNPWHIFNIWIQVLFDMGWLGLCSFVLLKVYVYYRLLRSVKYDIYAPILLASFTGFLIIGYVDSPFDAPRLTFLFFVLVIFAIFCSKKKPIIFNNLN